MSKDLAKIWREHMRHGDFESAWRISDRALQTRPDFPPCCGEAESTWRGEPLDGKRVLVRCCHGLGDTFQFIRYVPLLRRIASRVIVQTQAAVARVLEHMDGIDAMATRYEVVSTEDYDVAISLAELPHLFRTKLQTIPSRTPYLAIPPVSFSRTRNLRVGLIWEGSDWDQRRSVPVQLFAGFARITGVTLHILQRGRALLQRLPEFGIDTGNDDVYEAARIIAAIDLIITIDSMPAHLAGAIAVPTWVLLHSDCDWRWMQNRSDSPWYPSMRLFRQKKAGDWDPVIARVKQELECMVALRSHSIAAAA